MPTSGINTTGTEITRLVDEIETTLPFTSEGSCSFTFFLEQAMFDNGHQELVTLQGTDSSMNSLQFFKANGLALAGINILTGGATQVFAGVTTTAGSHKLSCSWATDDVRLYVDGVAMTPDTLATIPTPANMGNVLIGSRRTGALFTQGGGCNINELNIFPVTKTNDQLIGLST